MNSNCYCVPKLWKHTLIPGEKNNPNQAIPSQIVQWNNYKLGGSVCSKYSDIPYGLKHSTIQIASIIMSHKQELFKTWKKYNINIRVDFEIYCEKSIFL